MWECKKCIRRGAKNNYNGVGRDNFECVSITILTRIKY